MTDRRVGFHKLPTQLLEFAELRHFSLGLVGGRRSGQGFGDDFATDLIGESEIGAMRWLSGLMTADEILVQGCATPAVRG